MTRLATVETEPVTVMLWSFLRCRAGCMDSQDNGTVLLGGLEEATGAVGCLSGVTGLRNRVLDCGTFGSSLSQSQSRRTILLATTITLSNSSGISREINWSLPLVDNPQYSSRVAEGVRGDFSQFHHHVLWGADRARVVRDYFSMLGPKTAEVIIQLCGSSTVSMDDFEPTVPQTSGCCISITPWWQNTVRD